MTSPGVETILALRALGLGDTYAAVPALRGLRRLAPGAALVLAGPQSWGSLLVERGVVDAVVPTAGLDSPVQWSGSPPDLAVNLHGCGPRSHRLLSRLDPGRLLAFAAPGFPAGPAWDATEHEVDRWVRLVRTAGGRCGPEDLRLDGGRAATVDRPGPVVVHPGAASPSRRWPVERWGAVVKELRDRGEEVVVTGGPGEELLTAQVCEANPGTADLGGQLHPADLSRLVEQARRVLSGDTGVAHLAVAHAVPSVTLYGPVPPSLWGPRIDREIHVALWRPQPGEPDGDPHGDRVDPRLMRITVADVVDAVDRLDAAPTQPAPQHVC